MKKEILSWIGCFVVAILAALFIVTFVGQRVQVDGHSMEDTLQDRDNLICDKLSYRFTDPERFDIVVIYPDDQKDKRWIKRIIGLPGETVRIDEEGNIYINGEILDEDYGIMVGIINGKIKRVPLAECAGKLKMVSPKDQLVKAAKQIGISFGD